MSFAEVPTSLKSESSKRVRTTSPVSDTQVNSSSPPRTAVFSQMRKTLKDEIGNALGIAQLGGKHPKAKPWKGEGSGVFEIVDDYDGDTYRAVYTVRFEKAVYTLHAFQKKSPAGIKTARQDKELVTARLRQAQQHYEAEYGEKSKSQPGADRARKR